MFDRFIIEEWDVQPDTPNVFRVFEKAGRWPFRRWQERGEFPTKERAETYIRSSLVHRPRRRSISWYDNGGKEDLAW